MGSPSLQGGSNIKWEGCIYGIWILVLLHGNQFRSRGEGWILASPRFNEFCSWLVCYICFWCVWDLLQNFQILDISVGFFRDGDIAWLVNLEAGIFVQLLPGIFFIFPSALLTHWNKDRSKCLFITYLIWAAGPSSVGLSRLIWDQGNEPVGDPNQAQLQTAFNFRG